MQDLFGEQRIDIKGNQKLENVANHILKLVNNDATLLDGESIKEINSKVIMAVWKEEGLMRILNSDQVEAFTQWMMSSTNADTISRTVRYLAEHDNIRLPSKVVQKAEQQRSRISSSFRRE